MNEAILMRSSYNHQHIHHLASDDGRHKRTPTASSVTVCHTGGPFDNLIDLLSLSLPLSIYFQWM